MATSAPRVRVVVVGGGIGGLAAAWWLAEDPRVDVLLLEGAAAVGGKLRAAEVGGVRVDVGAEAMLHRRPEGIALAREAGLELVHPTPATSRLWTRGRLRALPRTLMGVPMDVDSVRQSGALSDAGLARLQAEPEAPTPLDGDVSVGDLVAARLGDEVTDRLVEPLLGGVYAGRAREISVRAAVPQLAALAARGPLLPQAAALPRSDAPVFAGIPGGMARLPQTLVAGGRFEVRTATPVRELHRGADGWRLTTGPTTDERRIDADIVVLAVPPAAAARLLDDAAPTAAADLAGIETASSVVVTLAYRAADAGAVTGLGASGFLVPPIEGRAIKAATFSFAKWDWVAHAGRDLILLRTSLGRHRETAALQVDDAELVGRSLIDLAEATGLAATPVDTHVQRWGGGLPQYSVGHLDRVARIRAAVAELPGLAVCGAAYDGVGIPAVIGSARAAVDQVLRGLPVGGTMES